MVIKDIVNTVCLIFNITLDELRTKDRSEHICNAKCIVINLIDEYKLEMCDRIKKDTDTVSSPLWYSNPILAKICKSKLFLDKYVIYKGDVTAFIQSGFSELSNIFYYGYLVGSYNTNTKKLYINHSYPDNLSLDSYPLSFYTICIYKEDYKKMESDYMKKYIGGIIDRDKLGEFIAKYTLDTFCELVRVLSLEAKDIGIVLRQETSDDIDRIIDNQLKKVDI